MFQFSLFNQASLQKLFSLKYWVAQELKIIFFRHHLEFHRVTSNFYTLLLWACLNFFISFYHYDQCSYFKCFYENLLHFYNQYWLNNYFHLWILYYLYISHFLFNQSNNLFQFFAIFDYLHLLASFIFDQILRLIFLSNLNFFHQLFLKFLKVLHSKF